MVPLISHNSVTGGDQLAEITTYQGAMSFRIHAMGFIEIARVAAHAALENRTSIDAICPSIIYTTRHATELFLKHIIVEINEDYGVTTGDPDEDGKVLWTRIFKHDLMKLWDAHKGTIIEVLGYEAEHGEHPNFDHKAWLCEFIWIIDQLHEIDPDGCSLRYPVGKDKDGMPTPNLGGKMVVSMAQLERFADHAAACFERFNSRNC